MKKLRELILRFGGLFNNQRKDWELDEEIESHLQLHIEDNVRLGITPEEARRQALIRLGGVESTKEAYRDQRGLPVLETLWQDIRYGARMLRKKRVILNRPVTSYRERASSPHRHSQSERLRQRPWP